MKLFIPKCGDALLLTKQWCFKLIYEYRNTAAYNFFNKTSSEEFDWRKRATTPAIDCSLDSGTELVVDRIYIRQNANEYASYTFIIKSAKNEDLIGQRFWAHLNDVNTIECELASTGNFVGLHASRQFKLLAQSKKDPSILVKQANRKQAKKELEAAKAALLNHINTQTTGPNPHITAIKMNFIKYSQYYKTDSDFYYYLLLHYYWSCTAHKLDDGKMVRNFRFQVIDGGSHTYSYIKLAGYTIISRGETVLEIKELL